MHLPVNLVEYVTGLEDCPQEQRPSFAPTYERYLSKRSGLLRYKERELQDLCEVVHGFLKRGVAWVCLDGFHYSYTIPHISKEMDLLKVGNHRILNIELKHCRVSDERIRRQLEQNAYYLAFLGKQVDAFSYCVEEDSWFGLQDGELCPSSWGSVIGYLASVGEYKRKDLDSLFLPKNYLVSPVMNFDAFMSNEYFLSGQQESIKKSAMAYLEQGNSGGLVVRGDAGTGKTLLLYDVAKTMARQTGRRAAILHGAKLSSYHKTFNRRCKEIRILGPQNPGRADMGEYCFVGFDEAHRMHPGQFKAAMDAVRRDEVPFLVMIDPDQDMSERERKNDIPGICSRLVPKDRHLTLTKKFRTNPIISDFVDAFIGGKSIRLRSSEGIEVVYAPDLETAKAYVGSYGQRGYQYIALSSSQNEHGDIDGLRLANYPDAYGVIGLEYDKVVMVASYIHMEGKRLCDDARPNSDLLPTRMLYQGLTRARSKMALVVLSEWDVFKRAIDLLGSV